jgi:T5SS/PEP-CTERM-associated repeat protein
LWALAGAAIAPAVPATAQQSDWNNASGGSYQTAGNWSPVGVPPVANTIRFVLPGTYTVTLASNATANALSANAGDVTLSLNGNMLTLSSTNSNGVGSAAGATVRVNSGTFLPGDFSLGFNAGSTGTLLLNASSSTTIGTGGIAVGGGGTGNLTVQSGATLTTNNTPWLGVQTTGVGNATVTGSGSLWTAGTTLVVGYFGNGTLNVKNGGVVNANAVNIAQETDSVGKLSVTGPGATFTTNGIANIGGGNASSVAASAQIAVGPGGTVNLNGTTNLRMNAIVNLTGGVLNLNTLNITAGASVNWSAGKVQFANGPSISDQALDLFLAGTHTLGTNRTLAAASGTLTLNSSLAVNGGLVSAPVISINAGLSIGAFGTVQASDMVSLEIGKTMVIEDFGTLGATNAIFNNGGTLQLDGPNALVTGFCQQIGGMVQGTGRFAGGMNIGTMGTVRVTTGDEIIVDTSGCVSSGVIELAGGTMTYSKILSNLGGGFISGYGVFRGSTSSPGGFGLSNSGVVALSGGNTEIHGDVLNGNGGKIVTTGGSVTTFFDDVTHNGAEIRTSAGSSSVFLGSVSGAGPFTGTGTVYMEGDLRPGNSPAAVSFGGDLVLSTASTTKMELAGTQPGLEYDRLLIQGAFHADGALEVTLLNGYLPQAGQQFDLFDFGSFAGDFDTIQLPALGGTLAWDDSQLETAGVLKVVPEPGSAALLLLGLGMMMGRRSR